MANIWKQFENLLEKDTTQIATLIDTDGQRSTVEFMSGERARVTGTGTPGSKVFIKGQEIKEEAPSLPTFNMTLY